MTVKVTVDMKGFEDVEKFLKDMGTAAEQITAEGVYEGAGVLADALSASTNRIQSAVDTRKSHKAGDPARLPTPEEVALVQSAAKGVGRFDRNGTEVNTAVGFFGHGYLPLNGKMVPVALIVRSINSGTSFMRKQPFVRSAFNKSKKAASTATRDYIKKRIEALMAAGFSSDKARQIAVKQAMQKQNQGVFGRTMSWDY